MYIKLFIGTPLVRKYVFKDKLIWAMVMFDYLSFLYQSGAIE